MIKASDLIGKRIVDVRSEEEGQAIYLMLDSGKTVVFEMADEKGEVWLNMHFFEEDNK